MVRPGSPPRAPVKSGSDGARPDWFAIGPRADVDTMFENGSDKLMLVGLGVSAGGVEALMQFFSLMPADTGMAFVVVLHLAPEHESRLAEVLRAKTGLPVEQVREPVRVEPNRVYVVPPDRDLYMSDGRIRLAEHGSNGGRLAPIDLFFRTLADNYRERAIAVILSGVGPDGSVGGTPAGVD